MNDLEMMFAPRRGPSTPKRRRVAQPAYATPSMGSAGKMKGSPRLSTASRKQGSVPSPSALLAGIGGSNLFPVSGTSSSVPSTPRRGTSSARGEPATPTTKRKLSRTPASSSANIIHSNMGGGGGSSSNSARNIEGDRFIPNRPSMNFDLCNHMLLSSDNSENEPQPGSDAPAPLRREFQQALRNTLLSPMSGGPCKGDRGRSGSSVGGSPRVLSFTERPPLPQDRYTNVLKVLHTMSNTSIARASVGRSIPSAPLRILDAPDLVDDYYLNLISWGHNNVLAVALGQAVYLWNAATGSIEHLLTLPNPHDFVTSVAWMGRDGGDFLGVGTNHSAVQLWDASKLRQVRTMSGHSARVGTLAWKRHVLSSGSRDSSIIQHDVRMPNHKMATFTGHEQEVCGLKWSPDGNTLASGGNENFLCLWDASMSGRGGAGGGGGGGSSGGRSSPVHRPRRTLVQHQAAVKALAWCPSQRHLLASGGGTADRTIKFWNTANGAMLNSVDTGSQVCSLQWSRHNKELVSSHGFSENQLCLWKYPNMLKIKEFRGHTSRVLHMDTSPDGSTVVSAAADETLRFWDMFGSPPNAKVGVSKRERIQSLRGCIYLSAVTDHAPARSFRRRRRCKGKCAQDSNRPTRPPARPTERRELALGELSDLMKTMN
ncbi:conserved unknown protein [Ectocarpus siliculosus]|uniref:CDC20/Fizzy WD40 domain-containing protein n=1 Tax=Ectocarpus siliculosus TaxID=2880 RepID=D7G9G0_ECTSI|nr:conserved unknown protein [Ectocarpus siliculosus]|eukprot:CBJ28300.1 conserved unknown protein [Ectocarpus siliculosus]